MLKFFSKLLKVDVHNWPPEVSEYDKEVITEVIESGLSMVGKRRLIALAMAVKYVIRNDIPGDFVECGVWRGGASILAQKLFYYYGDVGRKFYLYDTFSGMTEPGDLDKRASTGILAKDLKPKGIGWCECSMEDVKTNIQNHGGDLDAYELIEGDVCETLKITYPSKVSILRLDTDWYESTKAEMETLYPRLVCGGVLHVDDYGHWTGSRKAVDEFFEQSINFRSPLFSVVDDSCRAAVKEDN